VRRACHFVAWRGITDAAFSWAASSARPRPAFQPSARFRATGICWVALGCGGNGITYSRIAAEIIRTALSGGTDPDAELYSFRR